MNPIQPSIDPKFYTSSVPTITAPATVPYKRLQQEIVQEFSNITKSREKVIPLLKALHEQWGLGQTPFPKWIDVVTDTFKKSPAWAYSFMDEMQVELGFNCSGKTLSFPEVGNVTQEQNEKCLSTVIDNRDLQPPPKAAIAKPPHKPPETQPEPAAKAQPQEQPESAPVVDKTGRPIPAYATEYWKRGSEVQHILSALSDLRTTVRKANEAGDRLWCAFDTQDLILSFDALYTSVSNFMPYAVCKKCNGLKTETLCSMCHGTGLINKVTYGFNKS